MSLSTRLSTSWELLARSLRVLRGNPRLMLFPLVSTLFTIGLALFFLAPVLLLVFGGEVAAQHQWVGVEEYFNTAFYIYGIVMYLVSMFAATFFNVAFYNEIMSALAGGPVSLGNGLRFAASRWKSILMWSLLAATVGLLIRAIEERLGWLGRIIMGFVGTVWSVAAVFAIPVIIQRGETNPFDVLRGSASTLKKTWGESLVGFVGLRLGGLGILLVTVFFGGIAIACSIVLQRVGFAISIGALWILSVIVISFLVGMATHIYRCALFMYASGGTAPAPYTAEMMDAAWKRKKP
jgi:hypothetical protein